jgi:hypothetical protein
MQEYPVDGCGCGRTPALRHPDSGARSPPASAVSEHPDLSERVGKDGIAVRELWVRRVEEYARHCRHADLLRECVDGRVGQ